MNCARPFISSSSSTLPEPARSLSLLAQNDTQPPEPRLLILRLSGAIQAALNGPDGDLRAAMEAEPTHHVVEMIGDGPWSDHQPLRDLLIAEPLGHAGRHL